MTPLIMGPSLGTSGIIWGMVGSQCFLLVSGVTLLFFDQPKN
jgi:membrane associated rhomboid family serine protease